MLMRRRVAVLGLAVTALAAVAAVPARVQVNLENVGPRIGATVPEFSGVDQFGQKQTLQTVIGREGAMLVFFRSADW
jgi:hypothetical protein